MSRRGMPSLVALLGLLAIAGYQNRDKIADMIGQATKNNPAGGPNPQGQAGGGLLGQLGGLVQGAGASAGNVLSEGLGGLVDQFKQAGQGAAADSWVKTGPNQPIRADQLEQAFGPDLVALLMQRTGLTREELLSRLSQVLPQAVDKLTPDGRLPTPEEAGRIA